MISRADFTRVEGSREQRKLMRSLARLSRQGYSVLATAPQPDQWSGKQDGPDDALIGTDSIRNRLADAGGLLDGIYYVPRSLMTQRRNRQEALNDIMARYSIEPKNIYLFSSSRRWAEMADSMGMNASYLDGKVPLTEQLQALLG